MLYGVCGVTHAHMNSDHGNHPNFVMGYYMVLSLYFILHSAPLWQLVFMGGSNISVPALRCSAGLRPNRSMQNYHKPTYHITLALVRWKSEAGCWKITNSLSVNTEMTKWVCVFKMKCMLDYHLTHPPFSHFQSGKWNTGYYFTFWKGQHDTDTEIQGIQIW